MSAGGRPQDWAWDINFVSVPCMVIIVAFWLYRVCPGEHLQCLARVPCLWRRTWYYLFNRPRVFCTACDNSGHRKGRIAASIIFMSPFAFVFAQPLSTVWEMSVFVSRISQHLSAFSYRHLEPVSLRLVHNLCHVSTSVDYKSCGSHSPTFGIHSH